MPTYEYRCADCGHDFEIVQSFTDDSLTVCPECGGRLKKVFSNVAISFKGSGFYVTDSASAKNPGSEPAGDSSSSGGSTDAAAAGASSGSGSADAGTSSGSSSTD